MQEFKLAKGKIGKMANLNLAYQDLSKKVKSIKSLKVRQLMPSRISAKPIDNYSHVLARRQMNNCEYGYIGVRSMMPSINKDIGIIRKEDISYG